MSEAKKTTAMITLLILLGALMTLIPVFVFFQSSQFMVYHFSVGAAYLVTAGLLFKKMNAAVYFLMLVAMGCVIYVSINFYPDFRQMAKYSGMAIFLAAYLFFNKSKYQLS